MKKPSKKTILSALSALFIGILGCALWEYVFSPLCTFVYIKISSLIDKFSVTFSNSTYNEISKGYNSSLTDDIIISMILIILLFSCILLQFFNSYQSNKKLHDYFEKSATLENLSQITKKNHRLYYLLTLFLYLILIIFMYWHGNNAFINQCKTSSLCNLEIICPYISDLEYKELKSSFYSIQTKKDYEIFTNTIKEIGDKYSLNLK